jgi:hypothetical protein
MRVFAAVACLVVVASCNDGPTRIESPDNQELRVSAAKGGAGGGGSARIKSVTVSPATASIEAGNTLQLSATTKPAASVTFEWASSNQSIATVSQSGLVTGVAAGVATISATVSGKTGRSTVTVTAPPPAGSEIMLGAGDISDCNNNNDEATAKLLDANPSGLVFLLGDNAYENGSASDYNNCYNPTWGRHKSRTKPSPGNHEYNTPGATGYYGYFGTAAGDPAKGYYSYDVGDWHVVVLNSSVAHDAASAQITWLKGDLTGNTKTCTMAYWHHPRFSSGQHGNDSSMQPYWDVLYEHNADLILNGHDHHYERFAPQTPTGQLDTSRGLREFIVGTGGRALYGLGTRKANSDVFNASTYGVMKLTLSAGSYSWGFLPIAGQSFTDSGTQSCH